MVHGLLTCEPVHTRSSSCAAGPAHFDRSEIAARIAAKTVVARSTLRKAVVLAITPKERPGRSTARPHPIATPALALVSATRSTSATANKSSRRAERHSRRDRVRRPFSRRAGVSVCGVRGVFRGGVEPGNKGALQRQKDLDYRSSAQVDRIGNNAKGKTFANSSKRTLSANCYEPQFPT